MKAIAVTAPIGIFDSGVGGLSVFEAIRRQLPAEDLIYVADSAHAPYGDRERAHIQTRAETITRFLRESGAKAIVVACNTATVVAVQRLREACPVPIIAMEPAIKPATFRTKSGVVGVLATTQTIASQNVARLCAEYGRDVEIILKACPGLVEQVERGDLDSAATKARLEEYILPLLAAGADVIVLGCTHYSFLSPLIRDIAGAGVEIVDPADAVAREVARRLGAGGLNLPGRAGVDRFFSNIAGDQASQLMTTLLGKAVTVLGLPTGC